MRTGRKTFSKVTIALFFIACLFAMSTSVFAAASYKTVYRKLLTKHTEYGHYYVLNVNKSGVPELIVSTYSGGTTSFRVYTAKSGKAVFCGTCSGRGVSITNPKVTYSHKYRGLCTSGWTNGIGGAWNQMYRMRGSKLKMYYQTYEYSNAKNKRVYEIGVSRKSVSKSYFLKYYNKYFKGTKSYFMKANTASARKKSFG